LLVIYLEAWPAPIGRNCLSIGQGGLHAVRQIRRRARREKMDLQSTASHLRRRRTYPATTGIPASGPIARTGRNHLQESLMTVIRTDLVLSASAFSHIIDVPFEKVDIAKWLFALPDAEYQRCAPPDHIAAGATYTDDGRRMSINVEMIGTGLVVQHYVGEVTEPAHCKMVSTSDVFTPAGRTKVQVIWDLSVKKLADGRCEYTNSVLSHPTDEFLAFIDKNGITWEKAAADRQSASGDHNSRETPLFAESIARAARAA
jgi:hypothetical protein